MEANMYPSNSRRLTLFLCNIYVHMYITRSNDTVVVVCTSQQIYIYIYMYIQKSSFV